MTKRDFISVVIRLLGIIALLMLISFIPYLFRQSTLTMWSRSGGTEYWGFELLNLLIVYPFLIKADYIAGKLIPHDNGFATLTVKKLQITEAGITQQDLFTLVVRILAGLIVVNIINYWLWIWLVSSKDMEIVHAISEIVYFVCGICLLFGAKHLSRWLYRSSLRRDSARTGKQTMRTIHTQDNIDTEC